MSAARRRRREVVGRRVARQVCWEPGGQVGRARWSHKSVSERV